MLYYVNHGCIGMIPSLQSLEDERTLKIQMKENIFNIVLSKCVEKIVYTNRHSDKTYILFEVPKIIIGHPSYDLKSCLMFLHQSLRSNGYVVEFIEPFYLYIDWGTPANKSTTSFEKVKKKLKVDKTDKLKTQTQELLKKYPHTDKVVYVLKEDNDEQSKKKKKHKQ